MFGVLRSRNGSCMVCCIARAEPVRENKAYKINCFLQDVEEFLIFENIPCIKNLHNTELMHADFQLEYAYKYTKIADDKQSHQPKLYSKLSDWNSSWLG